MKAKLTGDVVRVLRYAYDHRSGHVNINELLINILADEKGISNRVLELLGIDRTVEVPSDLARRTELSVGQWEAAPRQSG